MDRMASPAPLARPVVVALSGAPGGDGLIRRAAQIAHRRGAELVGVHVHSDESMAYPYTSAIAAQRALLDEFGGRYVEIRSDDIAAAITRFLREHPASDLVLGATRRGRWARVARGSIVGPIVDASVADVHVVSHDDGSSSPPRTRHRERSFSVRRQLWGLAVGALALPLLTGILVALRDHVGLATDLLVYLLAVLLIGAVGGRLLAMISALAAFLLANWYLTPPIHTWSVGHGENLAALIVFVAVGTIAGSFVDLAARRTLDARRARAEAETLGVIAARAHALDEANKLRSALLQSVSHDLRTPLASIKAAVSTLRQPDVDWPDATRSELQETIETNADRLTALVSNLLDLSRIHAGALSPRLQRIAFDDVIAAALRSLPDGAERVTVEAAPDAPEVTADAALLERVVANLVANAVAHSPNDQRVTISTTTNSSYVGLQIVDRGPGIPLDQRAAMLEPFQRLSDSATHKGIGLGLAIAHGFTKAMHGELSLDDTPGGGLTATIRLRRADQEHDSP